MLSNSSKEVLQYCLGGLLYTPALNSKIAIDICQNKYTQLRSIAFCMEDAISENSINEAEEQLVKTFEYLSNNFNNLQYELPLIFLRTRNVFHMQQVLVKVEKYRDLLTGFILPKFDTSNADAYISLIKKANASQKKKYYFMPILESIELVSENEGTAALIKIKEKLDSMKEYILNVRIGANDFCNIYGIRRGVCDTIYDIMVIKNILSKIINIFSRDYVVSGAVWEYFDNGKDNKWLVGLEKELSLDRLNGFIGKTAIHPSQLSAINNSLMVEENDYKDALNILEWKDEKLCVSKSQSGTRMNEQNVHSRWANKILTLAKVYGVKCETE